MPAIERRLKEWEQRLLDLSGRNPLLYFGRARRTAVSITSPPMVQLFDQILDGKKLRLPEPAQATLLDLLTSEDTEEVAGKVQARRGDLETPLEVEDLQRKLSRLRSRARASIEEQGINTLYLAFGILEWREAESAEETVRSPLVLLPVSLRYERNKPFTLEGLDEDITDNAVLKLQLERDFHVELPPLPTTEYLTGEDVSGYLADVERLLQARGWRVLRECWLSIFSFESLVLYRDIADNAQLFSRHPVLQWLSGDAPPENPGVPDFGDLDSCVSPSDVFPILDADDSQLEVILRARAGQNLVVHGPPGTGKSQTIANLIAQSIRDGKTVLFVSRKMAALEVVYDRLEREGLGDLCLEVHSHRSNKKDVIQRLNASFERGRFRSPHGLEEFDRLSQLRERLNAYAKALLQPIDARNRSPYQIYGILAKLHDMPDVKAPVTPKQALKLRRQQEEELAGAIQQLSTLAEVFDGDESHPWRSAALRRVSPQERLELTDALREVKRSLEQIESAWSPVKELTGLEGPSCSAEVPAALELAEHLASAPFMPASLSQMDSGEIKRLVREVKPATKHAQQMTEAHAMFSQVFSDEVLDLPVLELAERYGTRYRPLLGFLPLRFLRASYRRDASTLRSVAISDLPVDYRSARNALEACVDYANHRNWLTLCADSLRENLGPLVENGADADWEAIELTLDWVASLIRKAGASTLSEAFVAAAESQSGSVRTAGKEAATGLKEANQELEKRIKYLVNVFPEGLDETPIPSVSLGPLRDQIAVWLGSLNELDDWAAYRRALDRCEELRLSTFVRDAKERGVRGSELPNVLRKALASAWITAMYDQEPVLADFNPAQYDQLRDEFRELDKELRRAAVRATLLSATARRPETTVGAAATSEIGILRRQGQLRRRHQPLRRLFSAIPTLLPVLKPCLLMSPLSVASYLPPDVFAFDIVIFDEASQIPPEEAVGAIARGHQTIVAGDEKQLPPTSFFRAMVDDTGGDDEEEDLTPLTDSILELSVGLLPEAYLRWHYRSKHETLIAFSNHEFYDGRLITFPSPDHTPEDGGVRFLHCDGGVFDRGGSRTNRKEARQVAEMVIEHFRQWPSRSLGVMAMSLHQQDAIEHELFRLRLENPDLEGAFEEERVEHFFVKNLERMQGDERDSIIISLGYGPDHQGVVRMQFGPLSQTGGERRLNVAVTRGKLQTTLVSSLLPPQLDLGRLTSGSRGVVAVLQRYMEYAANGGRFPVEAARSTGEPQTEFEEAVLERLRREGLEVDPQVGASSFRIDLAVRHPDRPGRYILGIECDGATFHRTMSARERDRLRQEVLEGLGWRIFRIWSPDWFRDPSRVVSRIMALVEELRHSGDVGIPASNPGRAAQATDEDVTFIEDDILGWMGTTEAKPDSVSLQAKPIEKALPEYRRYAHGFVRPRKRFYNALPWEIRKLVCDVVKIEAPVHISVVAQRVAEVYGLGRVGAKIRSRVLEAAQAAAQGKELRIRDEFLWRIGQAEVKPRQPATADDARRATEVCIEEIAAAVEWVLAQQMGMPRDELVRQTARALGYDRVGRLVQTRVNEAVTWLLKRKRLARHGSVLSLARRADAAAEEAVAALAEGEEAKAKAEEPAPAAEGEEGEEMPEWQRMLQKLKEEVSEKGEGRQARLLPGQPRRRGTRVAHSPSVTVKLQTGDRAAAPRSDAAPSGDQATDALLALLRSKRLEVVDERPLGGHLWVIGGKELYSFLSPRGFIWGPRGAPATGDRPGWYLQ
jgi:very-short-patch-repair endonuclease